jgi:hypothetical protein
MDTVKKLYSHAPKDDLKKLEKEVSSKLITAKTVDQFYNVLSVI